MPTLAQRLAALGLVKPEGVAELAAAPARLAALCDEGWLVGGLSVALDVRPDEALGPLLQAMGGDAPRLRVLDARAERDEAGVTLTVRRPGKTEDETWRAEDVPSLVDALNTAFAKSPRTGVVVVIGEWNDALQLWCLARQAKLQLETQGITTA